MDLEIWVSTAYRSSEVQQRIWRTYLSITIVFAIVNGVYSSYAFLYIKHKMEIAGGGSASILDNLLFIIVVSMIFEFFAEPITGDWADAYGRRRVIVGTFLGLCLAFVAYWAISADAVAGLEPAAELRAVVALSLVAEFFFATASALFNGALDAWFVDELRRAQGPTGAALLPLFSAQRRWFGVFMVAGGVVSLWLARNVLQGGTSASAGGLLSVAALPWIAATVLTAGTALWVKLRLVEHHSPAPAGESSYQRIRLRLRRALSSRELRNALLITSVLYTCWICFMYLQPVLLTEKSVRTEAGVLEGILNDYYWFYLAMGTSRFLGPYLSTRFQLGGNQVRQFRWWGVLNCGALALGGVVLLLRSHDATGAAGALNLVVVPVALVLFWLAKVAEEAFKPVRSTYLNHLVVDGNDRAFVLSLATPFGAVIVLVGIGLLAVAQSIVPALAEIPFSVPLLFAILGVLGVVVTLRLSRVNR